MPSSSVDQEVRESCRTKGATRFFAPIVLHVWPIVIGQIRWPYKLEALYGHRLRLLVQGGKLFPGRNEVIRETASRGQREQGGESDPRNSG